MKTTLGLAVLATIGAAALSTNATAVPLPAAGNDVTSAVEPVATWRYHRSCGWRGGRWVVDLGGGKLVVCRPNRPGKNWMWHREGNREGWWDRRRKAWHNDKW